MSEAILATLNKQQLAAATDDTHNILLLAVPGSGKTTVIMARLAFLCFERGVQMHETLNLTFSTSSARDMEQRFNQLFPSAQQLPHFQTIHSLAFGVINTYGSIFKRPVFKVLSHNASIISRLAREIWGEYKSEEEIEGYLQQLSRAENLMLTAEQIADGDFLKLQAAYKGYKIQEGLMDFDDMLKYAEQLLLKYPQLYQKILGKIRYIQVDEAQDTSLLQHRLLQLIAQNKRMFMVGDEDQSIYGFRGAEPKYLLEFEKIYPNSLILFLEINYRSGTVLVEKSSSFIKQNQSRKPKNMQGFSERVGIVQELVFTELSEQYSYLCQELMRKSEHCTMAVLYRNNESAVPLVNALLEQGLDFTLREHKNSFFQHFLVQDTLAFLRLGQDSSDGNAFQNIYYKLRIGLKKIQVENMEDSRKAGENVFDALKHLPELEPWQKKQINKLKRDFMSLGQKKPLAALSYLEHQLGYGEHLSYLKEHGYWYEGLHHKLNCLRSIAASCCTIEAFQGRLKLLEDTIATGGINRGLNPVVLSTVHSAKGLEFDQVYLLDLLAGVFPSSTSLESLVLGDRQAYEEEVRLFYVAATRAKESLTILTSVKANGVELENSVFIQQFLGNSGLTGSLVRGMRVEHQKFGQGLIIREEKDKLTVVFGNGKEKILSKEWCVEKQLLKILP
ncbi:MAG: ATP-dependent helicase [Clostridia bacterium]